MNNLKIGFNFVTHFFKSTYVLAVFNDETSKVIFIFKNKLIFMFNDIRLNTQRFDKKN